MHLSTVYCPGADGMKAQLGLSFNAAPNLAPEPGSEKQFKGSIQNWFNSIAQADGTEQENGWCFNKPAKGECSANSEHQCHHWLLQVPVVWIMNLESDIIPGVSLNAPHNMQ